MAELILDTNNFDETVSSGVTLVDFWAERCGPCQMMLPVIAQFAEKMEGKMKVAKVDVDSNQEIAAKFGIMSVPTIIIFKDGEIAEQLVGAQPLQQLEAVCEKYL